PAPTPALSARGPVGGAAAPHEHRAGPRRGRGQRPALFRDAVHPGAGPRRGPRRAKAAAAAQRDGGRRRGCRRTGAPQLRGGSGPVLAVGPVRGPPTPRPPRPGGARGRSVSPFSPEGRVLFPPPARANRPVLAGRIGPALLAERGPRRR